MLTGTKLRITQAVPGPRSWAALVSIWADRQLGLGAAEEDTLRAALDLGQPAGSVLPSPVGLYGFDGGEVDGAHHARRGIQPPAVCGSAVEGAVVRGAAHPAHAANQTDRPYDFLRVQRACSCTCSLRLGRPSGNVQQRCGGHHPRELLMEVG